jgi:hypothetical protein
MKNKSNFFVFTVIFLIGLMLIVWGYFFNYVHFEIGPVTGSVLKTAGLITLIIAIIVFGYKSVTQKRDSDSNK